MDKPQEVTVIIDNVEDFIADEAAGEPGQQEGTPGTTSQCTKCKEPLLTEELVQRFQAGLAKCFKCGNTAFELVPAAECGRLAPAPAEESARLALPVEQSSPEELQRACNQIEKDFPPDPDVQDSADELQGTLSPAERQFRTIQAEQSADALWRAGLEAEMRPIAQRAGRKLFTLCASINNAHVGLGLIAQVAQQTKTTLIQLHARQAAAVVVQKLHHTSVVLDQAIAALITGCAEASGFTREQIVEVQTDMLRARQLAQAAPPSGIVLPSGGH